VPWSPAHCDAESDASRMTRLIPSKSLPVVVFSLWKIAARPSLQSTAAATWRSRPRERSLSLEPSLLPRRTAIESFSAQSSVCQSSRGEEYQPKSRVREICQTGSEGEDRGSIRRPGTRGAQRNRHFRAHTILRERIRAPPPELSFAITSIAAPATDTPAPESRPESRVHSPGIPWSTGCPQRHRHGRSLPPLRSL